MLSQGRIQLRIATEVTDVDSSKTLQIDNTVDPRLPHPQERDHRRAALGRLDRFGRIDLLADTVGDLAVFPGLMNLPVLGALFRSRDYLREETELLIVVTPYIVHAVDPKDMQRPEAGFADASDPQAWLLGKVNRIYSSSNVDAAGPTYTGKVGFITD